MLRRRPSAARGGCGGGHTAATLSTTSGDVRPLVLDPLVQPSSESRRCPQIQLALRPLLPAQPDHPEIQRRPKNRASRRADASSVRGRERRGGGAAVRTGTPSRLAARWRRYRVPAFARPIPSCAACRERTASSRRAVYCPHARLRASISSGKPIERYEPWRVLCLDLMPCW